MPYQELRGIALPSYVGEPSDAERREIASATAGNADGFPWHEIDESEVDEFDLVTFRLGGTESHVGLVPWKGAFLHSSSGITSRIERYSSEPWRPLVSRFLRYGPSKERVASPPTSSLVALPLFDAVSGRIELTMPPGGTVADAVKLALPGLPPEHYGRLRVTIGERWLPCEVWEQVVPALGETVLIRAVPGANDLLRALLTVAVTVAAIAAAQLWAGPALAAAVGVTTPAGVSAITAVTSLALTFGGTLLINALIPPSSGSSNEKQTYSINGFQNAFAPDAPVPQLYGEMRFAPQYAVFPYTENVGDDRYVVAVFLLSTGPLDLSDYDPWIGMTPLSKFDSADYQINVREGRADDLPLTLYNKQVIEEVLTVACDRDNDVEDPQTRVTAADVIAFDVELLFQGGMFLYNSNGDERPATMTVRIRYRLIDTVSWASSTVSIREDKKQPFWRTFSFGNGTPLTRGQYEVEVTRITNASALKSPEVRFTWSALRSYRPEYPLNYDTPVSLIEIKVRASGKLNGTLETFNVLGRRECLDWNGSAWVTGTSSNPASIARLLLQGPQAPYPEPDSAIDFPSLQELHEFCTEKGLTYNAWKTDPITLDDALTEVCHAGRAFWYWKGNKRTFVIDRPRTQFYDHVGPNNSWGIKENDPPVAFPDAFATTFLDKTNKYVQARRVVPRPGFVGTPIIVHDLPQPGKTDPAEIYIEATRRHYESIYRRRSWTVNQDAEHLAINRGDAGFLAHFVIDRRQVGGWVRSVSDNGVSLDEIVTMEEGGSYKCRFRASDGSTMERAVLTVPGQTKLLTFSDVGSLPEEGDLAIFYSLAAPIREVIAKDIKRAENHGGQITFIDHAPEIDTLTDATVVPSWDGRVGDILDYSAPAPDVPSFAGFDTDPDTYDIAVLIAPAAGGTPPASYTVAHRLSGVGAYSTVSCTAGEASVLLAGYTAGQSIDLKVLATGSNGLPSAYSPVTTYTIGVVPRASSIAVRASSGFIRASLV